MNAFCLMMVGYFILSAGTYGGVYDLVQVGPK
jgi:hypothetical protein